VIPHIASNEGMTMDFRANLETAQTYLEAGLKQKAVESMCKIYNSLRERGIDSDRETFLRLMPMMAKATMDNGRESEAMRFLDEGLSVDQNDSDLLFLKAMCLRDQGRHDEMFVTLVSYLNSLSMQDMEVKEYRYVNDLSVKKVFETLVPEAYGKSLAYKETGRIVKELAGKTDNPYLIRLAHSLDEIDKARELEPPYEAEE
jgi:hypothetical protein